MEKTASKGRVSLFCFLINTIPNILCINTVSWSDSRTKNTVKTVLFLNILDDTSHRDIEHFPIPIRTMLKWTQNSIRRRNNDKPTNPITYLPTSEKIIYTYVPHTQCAAVSIVHLSIITHVHWNIFKNDSWQVYGKSSIFASSPLIIVADFFPFTVIKHKPSTKIEYHRNSISSDVS